MISFFKRKFCWSSSTDTIKNRQVSLLALAEVMGAIALFWWFVSTNYGYWILIAGLIYAPLVMLRSDESTKMAEHIWNKYYNRRKSKKSVTWIPISIYIGILGIISIMNTFAFDYWQITSHSWGSVKIIIYAYFASILFATTAEVGTSTNTRVPSKISGLIGVAIATLGVLIALFATGNFIKAAAFFSFFLGISISGNIAIGLVLLITGVLAVIGGGAGYLFYCLAVRFFSVLCHLDKGIRGFYSNWCKSIFYEDFYHLPQHIPGVKTKEDPSEIWKDFIANRKSQDPAMILYAIPSILIFCFASYFCRLSVKSTTWFYWPILLMLGWKKRNTISDRSNWITGHRSGLETLLFIWSLGVLIIALLTLVDFKPWTDLSQVFTSSNESTANPFHLINSITLYFVFDLKEVAVLMDKPWKIFSLINSLVVVSLIMWLGEIRRNQNAELKRTGKEFYDINEMPVMILVLLSRVSTILLVSYFATVLWYLIKLAVSGNDLNWFEIMIKQGTLAFDVYSPWILGIFIFSSMLYQAFNLKCLDSNVQKKAN